MQGYLIRTKRLGLRLLEAGDLELLLPLESDPGVKQYFPDGPRDREKTEAMIARFLSAYELHRLPNFLLFDLQTADLVGRAGFGLTENGEIEVGYVLHKRYWGQGLASEAVLSLLEYARNHIEADAIIAYATTDNLGSTRVMEKCGMEYYKTGVTKGVECRFYRIKIR